MPLTLLQAIRTTRRHRGHEVPAAPVSRDEKLVSSYRGRVPPVHSKALICDPESFSSSRCVVTTQREPALQKCSKMPRASAAPSTGSVPLAISSIKNHQPFSAGSHLCKSAQVAVKVLKSRERSWRSSIAEVKPRKLRRYRLRTTRDRHTTQ